MDVSSGRGVLHNNKGEEHFVDKLPEFLVKQEPALHL
jgi:hypothetical protein